ncbi:serine/threonine protein kinase [Candidatus Magnetoovum chiemensis]|nr:serine/threonine protein kinase [Candidatus Magnetoovum chiemensis]
MPAKVVLKIVKGNLIGKVFDFEERTTCIIGRASDCNIKLPDDEDHQIISRHHCLLDINPPGIRIRDMGSLNGTFVNGNKIGQRKREQSPKDVLNVEFPEYDLSDGDEIKLGKTVLKVVIEESMLCVDCKSEIAQDKLNSAFVQEGIYRCEHCRDKKDKSSEEPKEERKKKIKCSNCQKDVTEERDARKWSGDYVCEECRANPMKIAKSLVEDGLIDEKDKEKNGQDIAIKGYSIIKELGKGGMGAVYLAENNKTKELIALKVMLAEVAVNERSREMFLREVENTKFLKHPNIVQLLDYGNSKGTFYFTLEYCDKGSIDKLIPKKEGHLPLEQAYNIIAQALDGLDYAHNVEIPNVKLSDGREITAKGIVHRDIKPSNIFISGKDNVVKIADFGLGKAFDSAGMSGYTRTGVAAGTPAFMPRQQVINFKYAKPEVDVWSMMATFYYLLTGRFPRDLPKGKDPWLVVLQTSPVPIKKRNAKLPDKFAEVIDACLVDKPEIAFKSAKQVKDALKGVI